MTAADIRTRILELSQSREVDPVCLIHAALWLWCIDGSGVAPDRIIPGNCGEVFVEWGILPGEPYRHREFDGTNPDGEYWEPSR